MARFSTPSPGFLHGGNIVGFDERLSNQNERVLKTLFNIKLVGENKSPKDNKQTPEPRRIITKKIGRNEPCPCGSGKKYKQCHGS